MRIATVLAALALAASAVPGQAKELRFAYQADAASLDPYAINETFTLGFLGNVYEGLVRRGPDLALEPALAERWEMVAPTRWRFHLRRGVRFHDGEALTAADVLFSADRVRAEGSDLAPRLAGVARIVAVDDHTVDFVTEAPDPILPAEWDTWYVMSASWARAHGAETPEKLADDPRAAALRTANGTGPFRLVSREAGLRTVAEPNPHWWGARTHNLTRVTFTPIASGAGRAVALAAGRVDMAWPIPAEEAARVEAAAGARMMTGPELRTIFLGMDQFRAELLHASVEGRNPFKDRRVREAFYRAIDIAAIRDRVMGGRSTPAAMTIGPGIAGFDRRFRRLAYDPAEARRLLAAAGYAGGFEVGMDCPNDRYVNDAAICRAVATMLGEIGVTVRVDARPKSAYFAKLLPPRLDASFYLLGWTPGSFDSWNPLFYLHACPQAGAGGPVWPKGARAKVVKGHSNFGGYCNPELDALTARIRSETDASRRAALVGEAWTLAVADIAYIPLHQQALSWGVRDNVRLAQRADNQFAWRHVVIE